MSIGFAKLAWVSMSYNGSLASSIRGKTFEIFFIRYSCLLKNIKNDHIGESYRCNFHVHKIAISKQEEEATLNYLSRNMKLQKFMKSEWLGEIHAIYI